MNLILTEDLERVRARMRSLVEPLLEPASAERDRTCRFPASEIATLASQGILGLTVPETWGGGGISTEAAVLALAEVSRCCASTGLVVGFHGLVATRLILDHATPEARDRFLPRLASGELLAAVAMTDPPASPGHLPAARARSDGDRWILDGAKLFVPAAAHAGLFVVYARSGQDGRSRVMILLEEDARGLSIGPEDPLFGVRAAGVAPLLLDGCAVPLAMQLGGEASAREKSSVLFTLANLAVASQAVGIAMATFEKAVLRASEKEPSGSLLGSRQPFQWKLADMKVALDASQLFLLRAASALGQPGGGSYEAAQAKVFAGRSAARIADEAVHVFGGSGGITDGGVERHWRDAKTTELNPTSREAALLGIARHLLEEHHP